MSDVIYQYQQAYVPNNGNTFYFWVDCTKEIHDEEAREGGTVRTLYTAPSAPVLKLPEYAPDSVYDFFNRIYDNRDSVHSAANAVLEMIVADIKRMNEVRE